MRYLSCRPVLLFRVLCRMVVAPSLGIFRQISECAAASAAVNATCRNHRPSFIISDDISERAYAYGSTHLKMGRRKSILWLPSCQLQRKPNCNTAVFAIVPGEIEWRRRSFQLGMQSRRHSFSGCIQPDKRNLQLQSATLGGRLLHAASSGRDNIKATLITPPLFMS